MTLATIVQAAKSKTEITVPTDCGNFTGIPRISWVNRLVVLKSASGVVTAVEFDDIQGI